MTSEALKRTYVRVVNFLRLSDSAKRSGSSMMYAGGATPPEWYWKIQQMSSEIERLISPAFIHELERATSPENIRLLEQATSPQTQAMVFQLQATVGDLSKFITPQMVSAVNETIATLNNPRYIDGLRLALSENARGEKSNTLIAELSRPDIAGTAQDFVDEIRGQTGKTGDYSTSVQQSIQLTQDQTALLYAYADKIRGMVNSAAHSKFGQKFVFALLIYLVLHVDFGTCVLFAMNDVFPFQFPEIRAKHRDSDESEPENC